MAVRSRRSQPRLVALAALVPVVTAAVTVLGVPTAGAAVPASASGRDKPDLAMVIAGVSGRTTALRSGEHRFARLWQLLQPTYTGTERVPEAWAEGRYPPVRITVVWGLTGVGGWPSTNAAPGGDVAVERQDQLFLAEDGTPWVRSDPAPDVRDDDIRWHRAPHAVFEQLSRTGLLGGAVEERSGVTAGDGAGGGEGPAGLQHGAWWAVPGLAVGFAAGVGGTLLIRRAAARPGAGPPREEPRQELIDL